MSKQNVINRAVQELTVDPGVSGDSFVQFDINSTGEFRIGIDDTDDSFRISQGSALGTNDTFIMTDSGQRTMPLQPAFTTYTSGPLANVTGDGTQYEPVAFSLEVFDQGSNYNTGTYTFTAPVDGHFRFVLNVFFDDLVAAHTYGQVEIYTSNRRYVSGIANVGLLLISTQCNRELVDLVDMDAGDTAYASVTVSNSTKVVDVWTVSAADFRCYFSGYLAC